jgi:flavin reductase (DIM6/NTAB) family NADH-FMN oxidoreductase RutF
MDELLSILPGEMERRDFYQLLTSLVVPRPIAWVSTVGADGTPNLAPFSFFNAVAGNPPTLMVSISQRQGRLKDTLRNIKDTGEFAVHIVSEDLAQAMNQTSGEYPYEIDEFQIAGLESLPCVDIRPPRIASARAVFECRLTQTVPVQGSTNTMVLGQVVRVHLGRELLRPNGQVDANLLRPLARLGGSEYATLAEVFSMERPRVDLAG